MQVGRELDALVAEKVMGLELLAETVDGRRRVKDDRGGRYQDMGMGWWCRVCPDYSTDISAAWQVVEKMRSEGWEFHSYTEPEMPWQFCFRRANEDFDYDPAETAPLAICLAALKAKGVNV